LEEKRIRFSHCYYYGHRISGWPVCYHANQFVSPNGPKCWRCIWSRQTYS